MGYKLEEIFPNEEEKIKVESMKEVKREEYLFERINELNKEKERKMLFNKNSDKNKESKKSKENEESDSPELGEIKENKESSKHKKTFDSKDDDSSELGMDEEDDEQQNKKESENITIEDMKKIVLPRSFFEKYYFYPNFNEKVKGAFVRVNFSSTEDSSQPVYQGGYQIEEIEQIITKDKPYDFAGNKCTKNIKLTNSTNTVNFMFISNSDILDEEFNKLKSGEKPNIPKKEEFNRILNNIDEIKNKKLTNEEINEIISQKRKERIKYKDSTLNVTEELDRAMEQYQAMKEEYEETKNEIDDKKKENYFKKKKELEEDIKQLEKMKEERIKKAKMNYENDIVAKINEDIKEKRKMDEKISLLDKKRKNALNDKEHKLFKRVDCHPTNLFDSGKINVENLNLVKRETSDFIEGTKPKKKKNTFSYAKRIKQFKEFINSKKDLIEDMMENEKKNNNGEVKENKEEKKEDNKDENKEEKNQIKKNIDMSLFFKLANINYDMYNKMIKDQNKQNTKDPEIKILQLDEYLNENMKK